jgi:phage terminase large subunit
VKGFDFRKPNYSLVFSKRSHALAKIRADKSGKLLAALKVHYANNPWDFIRDWGCTYDPRNVERGLPAEIPFIPFERQVEFLKWLTERWESGERGLVEKSRDMGVTWLAVGWNVTMFLFRPGFAGGFGSRKEELVDKKGDPKSIFDKARQFVRLIPPEFRPKGWDERRDSTYMRMMNPENGSTITGESGDNIGRGGRQSIYCVDEASFVERQELVDAALSQTTNCQIDISTPNGNGNAFYRKRHSGKVPVFEFDWKDDPRKNHWVLEEEEEGTGRVIVTKGAGKDAPLGAKYPWYEKQISELDEVIVAQEIDRDYNASAENVFIPAKWVKASIDAHIRLGFEPSGCKVVAFDPADVGDAKARLYRHGSVILEADEMKKGDIRDAMPWVRDYAMVKRAGKGLDFFVYDADGMGAPAVKLSLEDEFDRKEVPVEHFHGSGQVRDKGDICQDIQKPNGDAFFNYRAQTWYSLRRRFEKTYEAIEKGVYQDPAELISISSSCTCWQSLVAELSRPQRKYKGNGKIIVESKPEMKARGVQSPNLADVANMAFACDRSGPRAVKSIEFEPEYYA